MVCTPFMRQLLVAGSPQLAALSVGGAVTYPSVLLQQFAANDSSIHLDLDTASWIGSIHGLAGIPSIVMPYLMQWRGRKLAYIVACLVIIIGWILAFVAKDITTILISESFHGFGSQSMFTVTLLSLSEMLAPEFRNVSVVLFFVLHDLGMALAGILGRFLHWKTVSIILSVPITLGMLMCCVWPESPSWLAYKGKFDECERSFVWLRGTSDVSRRELQELMTAQKINLAHSHAQTSLRFQWNTIRSRDFYLPCIHMFVLLNLAYWSGSLVILIYSVDMIQRATHSADVSRYGAIIMNCVLFVCVAINSVLIKFFTNKSVLHASIVCATVCLLSASAVNYLQSIGVMSKEYLTGLYLLIALIIAMGLGVLPLVFAMAAELIPVRHRGVGGALYVIFTCLLHTSSLKFAPYLFEYINLWGTLLLFAVNATVCGLIVWKYVPETKGRTLQQLEDYYVYGGFEKRHENELGTEKCLHRLNDESSP